MAMMQRGASHCCLFLQCTAVLLQFSGLIGTYIDPKHAMTMTVYHVNPASAGSLPMNQNTADAAGDLYWYLGQFLMPEECKNSTNRSSSLFATFDCGNAERSGDLVATQVRLEVDDRFTTYSACNLCKEGIDPVSKKPCRKGEYICDCFSSYGEGGLCDAHRVGKQNVYDQWSVPETSARCNAALQESCGSIRNESTSCLACATHGHDLERAGCTKKDGFFWCANTNGGCGSSGAEDWQCWRDNIAPKTRGYWYSTSLTSMCSSPGDSQAPSGGCAWQALSTRTIQEACLRDSLISVVEAENPVCFEPCGARNQTSPCWIRCFFDTVLGPDARTSHSKPLQGMPLEKLQQGWERSFRPEEYGGCPVVDMRAWDAAIADQVGFDASSLLSQTLII